MLMPGTPLMMVLGGSILFLNLAQVHTCIVLKTLPLAFTAVPPWASFTSASELLICGRLQERNTFEGEPASPSFMLPPALCCST